MSSTSCFRINGPNLPKGWLLSGSAPKQFDGKLDHETAHSGKASGTLHSLGEEVDGFGTLMQQAAPGEFAGKRVRLTAWIKIKEVAGWAGLWFRVDGSDLQMLAFDNMENRPLKGTLDWANYEIVLDVPTTAVALAYGVLLAGTGQAWLDDVAFEIVGDDVPLTDLIKNGTRYNPPTNLDFEE